MLGRYREIFGTYTENNGSAVRFDPSEDDVGTMHPSRRREADTHIPESLHLKFLFRMRSSS